MDTVATGAPPGRHGMPPEAPLDMPTQNLRRASVAKFDHELNWRVALARGVAFTGTLAIVGYGVR